jgi:hypothetical protein
LVYGNVCFLTAGTAPVKLQGWVSSTSATLPDQSLLSSVVAAPAGTLNTNWAFTVPQKRFSLSVDTTIFLSVFLTNTSGDGDVCGAIYADRLR